MSYIKKAGSGGDTYTLRAAQSGSDVDIQLDATAGADSSVQLKAGTNITLTEASDTISIDAAGGSPGGSNTNVQFNNGGSFAGNPAFTFNNSTNKVKIGNAAVQEDSTSKLHIVASDPDVASLTIEDQDDGSSVGPSIRFSRISASPAASDVLGQIAFRGKQTGSTGVVGYGSLRQEIVDPASATKTGRMVIRTINNNVQSDKLRIDSQITSLVNHNFQGLIKVNNQAGTAGQVLTSQGPSADPVWAAAGGSAQFAYTGALNADIYGSNTSLRSVYPLLASGQSATQSFASNWNPSTSTTEINFFPCIMPQTGTLDSLQFRTGSSSAGDTLHTALYASDSDGLPNGAAVFTNTITTPTVNTSYNPSISISGITKGDLYYFAVFGQASRTQMRTIDVSDGGTFHLARGLTGANWSVGSKMQSFELQGQTNGVFPTLSASTQYQTTNELTQVISVGIAFS